VKGKALEKASIRIFEGAGAKPKFFEIKIVPLSES
jgi:hypothetical protein